MGIAVLGLVVGLEEVIAAADGADVMGIAVLGLVVGLEEVIAALSLGVIV